MTPHDNNAASELISSCDSLYSRQSLFDARTHPMPRGLGVSVDIRRAWQLAFGEDILAARKIGPDQYRVLCPFHYERNPRCDVSTRKNVIFCRSCDAKGGTLDVIVHAGYAANRAEAAQWLRRRGVL